MKLSVSTLGCTEKNISEIASLCAECGIHGIEIRGIDGVLSVDRIACLSAENARETEKILNNSNVNIVGFGTSCAFHDPSKTESALLEGMSAQSLRWFLSAIEPRCAVRYIYKSFRKFCVFGWLCQYGYPYN